MSLKQKTKKSYTAEIETLIKENGIYWYTDDDGEVGINAGNINSIEFAQEQDKREAGLVQRFKSEPFLRYSLRRDFLSSSVVPPQTPES